MKIRITISLLAAAVLVACGGGVPTKVPTTVVEKTPLAQPTAAARQQPTVQPTAGAKEQPTLRPTVPSLEATRVPGDYDLNPATDLSKLESYRAAYSWTWTETKNGTTKAGYWEAHEEVSRRDAARHLLWTGSEGTLEVIQIGSYTYVNNGREWTSMLSSGADPFATAPFVSSPLGMIAESRGKLVERGVTVNGVLADHYTLVESIPGGSLGFGMADKAQGDVFVAQQLEIVVQYVAHYEGKELTISGGKNAVLDVVFNLTDINQPITLVAPEGVKPPLADDIPIMQGVTELTAIAGFVSFKTTLSVEDVTAFYKQAMVDKGWTAGAVAAGMLSFSKGQRQASVLMQAEGGQTTVTIMTGE